MLKKSFHPYAIITILCWALAYVLTRMALQYYSPFALGCLRYCIASLVFIVVAVKSKMKLPRRQDLPWFILAGAFGFFLYMIVYNQGQGTVTAATASIVLATVPVMTALMARVFYREKLTWLKWLAIAIEFSGVAVLTLMKTALSMSAGVLWLLLAALFISLYNLLVRRLTKTYSPLQTTAFSIFFGTLLLCIFLPASLPEAVNAPAIQWLYLAILGLFSSALAYVCWSTAFARAEKTSQVSNYMFITPFLTSILGFLIAHEIPDRPTLIGGAVILLGVFMFNFGERLFGGKLRVHK